jgi:choline transport protein
MIQGVAVLNNPEYAPQRWHATLMMIAVSGLATLMNTFGKKFLPLWETLAGAFHVLFFFIILIALNASGQKAHNADVWGTFINAGGWPNDGVSFCLGFVTPAFALAGMYPS